MIKNSLQWLDEFDYLRAFAILGVVSIHVVSYSAKVIPPNSLVAICAAVYAFASFSVPLFVFVSGFVLYYKYPYIPSLPMFYKRRFVSIIPPYIIFSTFYFYLIGVFNGTLTGLSVSELIFVYLTGTAAVPLWFFILLIQLYLLYPLLVKIFNRSVQNNKALFFVFAALLIQIIYLGTIEKNNTLNARFFCSSIFYFVLGMYLCKNFDAAKHTITDSYKKYTPLLLALPLPTFAAWMAIVYASQIEPYGLASSSLEILFVVSVITALLAVCLDLRVHRSKVTRTMERLGDRSFAIYLIHTFFIYVLVYGAFPKIHLSWNNWLFYPLLFLATLLLSYISAEALSYLPLHTYIVGASKSKKQRNTRSEATVADVSVRLDEERLL
jgi:probable poly-beta-1,6-N-acetyl-D-glucosamine export protein